MNKKEIDAAKKQYARVVNASERGYSLLCAGFKRGFLPKEQNDPLLHIDDYVCVVADPKPEHPDRKLFYFARMSTREEYRMIIDEAKKQKSFQ